jgi:hypothetical protein
MKKVILVLSLLVFNIFAFLPSIAVIAQSKLSNNWYLLYKKNSENLREEFFLDAKNRKWYPSSRGHNPYVSDGGKPKAQGGVSDIQKSGPYNSKKECEKSVLDLSKEFIFIACIQNN